MSKSTRSKSVKKGKKMPKWKEQSSQFRAAMKAIKQGKPAPAMEDSSRIQCEHCGRKFNEQAAERHIAFCAKKAKEAKMKIGPKKFKN